MSDCMFPCPVCGGESVLLHVGRHHWPVCKRCRVKWYVGDNLLSCWRELTEEDWLRNQEELKRYTLVAHD